jgi:hypothetical protein
LFSTFLYISLMSLQLFPWIPHSHNNANRPSLGKFYHGTFYCYIRYWANTWRLANRNSQGTA